MKKILTILVVVVVVALIFIFGNLNQSSEDVKIGAVLSLTGMAAVDGENIKSGIEFARLNLAKQGIDLEVIYEDDGTEPAKTVSSINKVVDIDKVDAIVGPTWSFLSAAAANTIQDKQIVSYNPANTSEHVEGESDYFLFGAPKNSLKEEETKKWLENIGAKKTAIVLEEGAWGDSHILPFENATKNVGGEVVLIERIPFSASGSDIQTIISKVKQSGAEAVLFTGFDSSTALFINKVDEIVPGLPLLVATEIARKQNEEGIINVDLEDNVYVIAPGASNEFQEAFQKEYGRLPGAYADRAYDGTMLLVKAILEKPEDKTLNEYVREMRYQGYMGTYEFDENNDLIGGEWTVEQLK